jgi:hypothetical protein
MLFSIALFPEIRTLIAASVPYYIFKNVPSHVRRPYAELWETCKMLNQANESIFIDKLASKDRRKKERKSVNNVIIVTSDPESLNRRVLALDPVIGNEIKILDSLPPRSSKGIHLSSHVYMTQKPEFDDKDFSITLYPTNDARDVIRLITSLDGLLRCAFDSKTCVRLPDSILDQVSVPVWVKKIQAGGDYTLGQSLDKDRKLHASLYIVPAPVSVDIRDPITLLELLCTTYKGKDVQIYGYEIQNGRLADSDVWKRVQKMKEWRALGSKAQSGLKNRVTVIPPHKRVTFELTFPDYSFDDRICDKLYREIRANRSKCIISGLFGMSTPLYAGQLFNSIESKDYYGMHFVGDGDEASVLTIMPYVPFDVRVIGVESSWFSGLRYYRSCVKDKDVTHGRVYVVGGKVSGKSMISHEYVRIGAGVVDSDDYGRTINIVMQRKCTLTQAVHEYFSLDYDSREACPSYFEDQMSLLIDNHFSTLGSNRIDLARDLGYMSKPLVEFEKIYGNIMREYEYSKFAMETEKMFVDKGILNENGILITNPECVVFFVHCGPEMHQALGTSAIIGIQPPTNRFLGSLFRPRSTTRFVQYALTQFYTYTDTVNYDVVPTGILRELVSSVSSPGVDGSGLEK